MNKRALMWIGWIALAIGIVAACSALITGFLFPSSATTTLAVVSIIVAATGLILSATAFLVNGRDNDKRMVVASGSRSIAAGNDVSGNVIGDGSSKITISKAIYTNSNGDSSAPSNVSATGNDAIAASGNVEGNVIGRESNE